jgi:hypothetical protein
MVYDLQEIDQLIKLQFHGDFNLSNAGFKLWRGPIGVPFLIVITVFEPAKKMSEAPKYNKLLEKLLFLQSKHRCAFAVTFVRD